VNRRILVIRLGALGDMALSFPAFAAIRAHHARDRVCLLTTSPYAALMRGSPWFDAVDEDGRPGWLNLAGLARLRARLRGFDLVYDLQTSGRSGRYFRLAGRPAWSGIARGCSLPDADPRRDLLHTVARQRGQLEAAGVAAAPVDLHWLTARGPVLKPPYALLAPGTSSAHGGAKTWPAARFADLAARLAARGLQPVVVGTRAERRPAESILRACPAALDLTGRTSIADLAGLAHRAALAVGGDTGPIHLAATMGCRTLALFSRYSDPTLAAPVGDARVVRHDRLTDATVDEVMARLAGGDGEADWRRP
jgi:ADP-heptose:LPS heptosyltransferase